MKDKLITGLLAVQVAISLALTAALWYTPQQLGWAYRESRVTAPPEQPDAPLPSIREMFRPVLVWAQLGKGAYVGWEPDALYHGVFHRNALSLLVETMELAAPLQLVGPEELALAEDRFLLGLDLPVALHPGDWARLFGASRASEGLGPVDRVIIDLGEPGALYWLGPERIQRQRGLPREGRLRLIQQLLGVDVQHHPQYRPFGQAVPQAAEKPGPQMDAATGPVARAEPWVMVPVEPKSPRSTFGAAGKLQADKMVQRFFPDVTVVREIEERDGAVIFTDGQRAVRTYANGALEYREPAVTAGTAQTPNAMTLDELLAAIRAAQQFVAARTGWPAGALLTGFERDANQQWRLFFSLYGSVVQGTGGRIPLEAHGTRDQISYLYRAPEPLAPTISDVEWMSSVIAAGVSTTVSPDGGDLRWIRPGYAMRSRGTAAFLVPVWNVGFSQRTPILVDARTGRLLP